MSYATLRESINNAKVVKLPQASVRKLEREASDWVFGTKDLPTYHGCNCPGLTSSLRFELGVSEAYIVKLYEAGGEEYALWLSNIFKGMWERFEPSIK